MEIICEANMVVIEPAGSLDINSSDDLRQAVVNALATGTRTLLINCQAITFLDSSGLSAMVMALKKARELNVRFALCAINEQSLMLFQLTGMNKVFDIFENKAAFTQTLLAMSK